MIGFSIWACVVVHLGFLVTLAVGFGFTTSGNSIIVTTDGGLVFKGLFENQHYTTGCAE